MNLIQSLTLPCIISRFGDTFLSSQANFSWKNLRKSTFMMEEEYPSFHKVKKWVPPVLVTFQIQPFSTSMIMEETVASTTQWLIWLFPKKKGGPGKPPKWMVKISGKTLWTNGWFGGYKPPLFWFNMKILFSPHHFAQLHQLTFFFP